MEKQKIDNADEQKKIRSGHEECPFRSEINFEHLAPELFAASPKKRCSRTGYTQ